MPLFHFVNIENIKHFFGFSFGRRLFILCVFQFTIFIIIHNASLLLVFEFRVICRSSHILSSSDTESESSSSEELIASSGVITDAEEGIVPLEPEDTWVTRYTSSSWMFVTTVVIVRHVLNHRLIIGGTLEGCAWRTFGIILIFVPFQCREILDFPWLIPVK